MWWQILMTAATSALCTLIVFGLCYYLWLLPRLNRRLEVLADEFEARVRKGTQDAGENLLPDVREQVRQGFVEAFSQWPSSEFRQATRTGADLVEEGLSALLRRRRETRD